MHVTSIQQIRKRNGETVEFTPQKIFSAITNAFASCNTEITEEKVRTMVNQVLNHLDENFQERTPAVEDVQDIVEDVIMENGFFPVAKAYIVYRYEHEKQREQKHQEVLEKIEQHVLPIVKSNGKKQEFDFEKMRNSLVWATEGITENIIDVDAIANQCKNNIFEGISSEEISKALILASRAWIEKDPAYSQFTSRLLLNVIYKETIGKEVYDHKKLDEQYRKAFVENIKFGIKINRLNERLLEYDLEEMSKHIEISRDDNFQYLGLQTLYDRYFLRDPEVNKIFETPQAFWMRVAMGLALNEKEPTKVAISFYNLISNLDYVPSTPTLFHSGTSHPQLSSCYLTTVEDSLDHIFKCIGDNAQLSKWSGGLGNDWTNLRATGALIKGTGVESQGIIPFLKIANDTTVAINRSGKRRGATCAYLENWHLDFEDYLELRKNTGDERRRAHDMNTATWIPDLFMKRVQANEEWTLFSPDEVPDLHHIYGKKFEDQYLKYEQMADQGKIRLFKKIKALDMWKKMISMLFETGHPWITFKDPCNIRSPQDHCGVIHSSNLCTEITLNTSKEETAVCNLGSINLSQHIKEGKLDEEKIAKTVEIAMRMLDNVIELNFYPTQEAADSNAIHRPVGLGVMGFQDALYKLGIDFDSEAAVQFADETQELISYHAIYTSSKIAKEQGAYKSYKGSKWDRGIFPVDTIDILEEERGKKIDVKRGGKLDWTEVREHVKQHGMRNSNCMAVAPTATISNIAGCTPTIEPIYKNIYVKSNMSGEFTIINRALIEELKNRDLWNESIRSAIKDFDGELEHIEEIPNDIKSRFKEVFDIAPQWLIKIAAHRGKWIDQSQSLNLFTKGTSGKQISDMYHYAWDMGLKTTYYLRSLGASHVEKSTTKLKKENSHISRVTKTQAEKDAEVKACLLDDPECEACQ